MRAIRCSESSTGVWYQDPETGMFFQVPHPRKLSDEDRRKMFDPIENAKAALKLKGGDAHDLRQPRPEVSE